VVSKPPGKESKADRLLRYEAQLIAQKFGKSLGDATEIARAMKAVHESQRQRIISSNQKGRMLKAERRHELAKKESMGTAKLNGLPLQGGAPGLGKRR
jgi:hypothetical protein